MDSTASTSKAAIYARFSTDKQSETSPEDQARLCAARASSLGLDVVAYFEDRAVSGATPIASRAGGRGLLAEALAGQFGTILVEGLDRLSRDLVDQERVLRRLEAASVRVIGVKDGYDSAAGKSRTLLRQVRGIINEVYRQDTAENTRRGQIGQFLRGYHAGGLCFGYRTEQAEGGRRLVIDRAQADVIRWIFDLAGREQQGDARIAALLNARGVASARGGTWKASAVREVLRQPLLLGKVVFGRFTWIKDPDTGRRRYRERPTSEWLVRWDARLRIVSDASWALVQARNAEIWSRRGRATSEAVRARLLARKAQRDALPPEASLLCCADCGSTRLVTRASGLIGPTVSNSHK